MYFNERSRTSQVQTTESCNARMVFLALSKTITTANRKFFHHHGIQMAIEGKNVNIHSFIVSDLKFPKIEGFLIEISTMTYAGFLKDIERLETWGAGITDDLVAGRINQEDLCEESISIRITSPANKVYVDTINKDNAN